MIRIILIAAAFLSPFLFPYPATLILALVASLLLPPVGIMIGLLVDALYYTSGASWLPVGILTGAVLTLLGILVRRFVKTRIIGS